MSKKLMCIEEYSVELEAALANARAENKRLRVLAVDWQCALCAHAVADENVPSGERPCGFCVRNPNWEQSDPAWRKWYDQSEPIRVPMDCYQPLDMLDQSVAWEEKQKVEVAKLRAEVERLRGAICEWARCDKAAAVYAPSMPTYLQQMKHYDEAADALRAIAAEHEGGE